MNLRILPIAFCLFANFQSVRGGWWAPAWATSDADEDAAPIRVRQTADDDDDMWAEFKRRHAKDYPSAADELARRANFASAKARVDAHNARFANGAETFRMATNAHSDLSAEEFQRLRGLKQTLVDRFPHTSQPGSSWWDQQSQPGSRWDQQPWSSRWDYLWPPFSGPQLQQWSWQEHGRRRGGPPQRPTTKATPLALDVPAALDWRERGYVTAVRNQDQCGDCWAFAAAGALEAQHFRATGQLTPLSAQNLVDCAGAYGNDGCEGGIMTAAFQYIACNGGIDTEASYPYKNAQKRCAYSSANRGATASGYVLLAANDETALQAAVAAVGPIAVVFDAEDDFQHYASGVYSSRTCSRRNINHALLIVGYGTNENGVPYWIVKNSWGTSWGVAGYANVTRGANACGIAAYSSYPTLNATVDRRQCA